MAKCAQAEEAMIDMGKPHRLDDVYARLDRADENFRNLKAEIEAFQQTHPHSTETDIDEAGELVNKVFHRPPPVRFSILTGEILFLLRSSLDQLIGQHLMLITPSAQIEAILERSAFPIYDDINKWRSFDWTRIPGISPDFRAELTSSQPCNRTDGGTPSDHPLAVLSRLNNIDKHRSLLIFGNLTRVNVQAIVPKGHARVWNASYKTNVSSTDVDAEIGRAFTTLSDELGGLDHGVEVYTNVTVDIAFKQVGTMPVQPVIPVLKDLASFVRATVDTYKAKFF